jgi:type IV pilus assembly protein PilW
MMVALVLGLLLLGAVLQFYLANKTSYVTQEQNGYVQEGGRFALDFIARDARMAGLSGCSSRRPASAPFTLINHLNVSDFRYDLMGGVRGYEASGTGPGDTLTLTATDPANAASGAGWSPALPAGTNGLENKVVPGSDVLVVSLTGPATPLVDPFTNGASFKTQTPHDLKQYEVAVSHAIGHSPGRSARRRPATPRTQCGCGLS